MTSLSRAQARRIALAAQGFTDRPHSRPTLRTLTRTVERTGVLQVDSVNVLQRAHYMPLYARMGPYDVDLLRRASSGGEQRRLVEYWAHVQALMPVELWPFMQHRMASYRAGRGKWFQAIPDLEREIRAVITERGASTSRQVAEVLSREAHRSKDHWGWNWSDERKVLDHMFTCGEVAIAGRNQQFEVVYDLPERVLPSAVLAAPEPSPIEAAVELVRRAARSHGVATASCLADYYRMRVQPARAAAADASDAGLASAQEAIHVLVDSGELLPVAVEGWKRPAYLHAGAKLPRKVSARTVLSPFDPLVWERERTERLFDFSYRIEIYVPAAKRVHGYYVLPFLLGDRIVARVDLKADRAARRLLVKAAHAEPGAPTETAAELAVELRRLAGWLALDEVVVEPRGDLAPGLGAEVLLT
ncbi:winged helix-turn-helix domain-containing protein [Nocardioides sp. JQ2195]|uniref:winged helix-turn-helix domain-containing protein n=1 Tax=Nocardioides sp. JQ2195 TaxID=2592334 RepID=UPI00143EE3FF|nr:crosslink repair DNA glycosylase YcaQ family protein [Nocardioides sp. JQ2195]QIX27664.1 winged helix-turn-helix domain-containing protein [Nocardioides sp. JQ2195]